MAGVYDVATVREAEKLLMAGLPQGALMDRAATGLADACATLLREAGVDVVGSRIVLLIGSGNNGGDALYAGARLARRGAQVRAICLSSTCHDGGAQALREAGGRLTDAAHGHEVVAQADLVVDGIVGIGGRGGLRAEAAAMVAAAK
ncbi:MAG: NAD(P)H-hydrate epimerase, partial [Candidatus Nanopelagicales bacterium]